MAGGARLVGVLGALGALSGLAPGPGTSPAAPAPAAPAAPAPSPRITFTIDDGWRYTDGDVVGGQAPEHPDGAWRRVDLPHTWNAEDAFDDEPGYRRGTGWYRKTLELPASLRSKRLFVRFEGANQVADVWMNGHPLGRHVGGYTAFAFDVTEHVRWDAPNVLAVRVDNEHDPDVPPLDADFTFYGGIYRDVWMVATEPVHVTVLDHASPGVFIDTPDIAATTATVRVRGTLDNATDAPADVQVVSRVLDPDGREVATLASRAIVPAGGSTSFAQRSEPVRDPLLWSPSSPAVYRVVTEVRRGAELMDVVNSPLGFRWLRVDPDQGAFLNGAPIRLVGTNRHQDVAGYGNAVPDALHRRDVRLIDATGFDFLRLAHYPQDPAVLDEMDRVGLVGWEEIPVVNTITMSDAFADNAERMLVEMIRQHYNHPSIVFWGYMNEIMLRIPDPEPDGYLEAIVALAERLEATAHAEDPGRITVSAISFGEIDNGTGFQDVPEVLGLNLYFGWYYRDEDGIGAFLDSLHARHPERPLMISEYGAGSDERIHAPEPVAFDFSTEHQQRVHEAHLPSFLDRGYLAGTAVWNHFDFGSAGRDDSRPDVNQKGLFRFDRTPKDVWHYYRAMLLDEPVLHVATDDHALRAGSAPVDAAQPVRVYANLGEVALAVNGVEVGTRAVSNGSATWTVTLESGENRIVARGTRAGRTIRDEALVVYEDRTDLFDARGHRGHRGGPDDPDDPDDPGDRPTTRDRVGTVAPPLRIAVNAGAGYAYADGSGTVWEADRPHEIGGWGYVGGEARLSHRRIRGSEDDALFQATREGASAYRFDVVDGAYDVRIALAETRFDRPGARSVTVHVNGVPVFEDVDLAASSGPHTAVERTVRVSATGGEGILVKLEAAGGGTTVSGVEVHRR